MTHGRELWGWGVLEGEGGSAGQRGERGERGGKNWDNSNSIINKIYLKIFFKRTKKK